jgi:hypothetical protein
MWDRLTPTVELYISNDCSVQERRCLQFAVCVSPADVTVTFPREVAELEITTTLLVSLPLILSESYVVPLSFIPFILTLY